MQRTPTHRQRIAARLRTRGALLGAVVALVALTGVDGFAIGHAVAGLAPTP